MTESEVIDLLRANRNDRGVKHWAKLGDDTGGLKSFGIGLTVNVGIKPVRGSE